MSPSDDGYGGLIFLSTSVGVNSIAASVDPGGSGSIFKERERIAAIRATTQLQRRCGGRGRASAGCLLERRAHGCIMEKGMHFGGPDNAKTLCSFFVIIT